MLAAMAGLVLAAPMAPAFAGASGSRPPAAKRVPKPRVTSGEYVRSWGLASINAGYAYRRGVTGDGTTVAVIDTGVGLAQPEVLGNVSTRSIDLVAERRVDRRGDRHGGDLAGLLAASLDGSGLVGVAYGGKVLSIRADIDGSCARHCAVRGQDLARGIDYAVANGARVIAVALVGNQPLPSIEPALARAAAAGAVIVAAAGNEAAAEPSWPARYAADPRFAGSVVVAGASRPDGTQASWSNRAGSTAARYVAAPGENVVVNCDAKFCNLASGTSYSVAYTAGALALVMQRQPELSARHAAAVLLAGARPMRDVPVAVQGRGVLDVGRAIRGADAVAERSTD